MNAAPSTNTILANRPPGWWLFFQAILPAYLFMGVALLALRKRLRPASEVGALPILPGEEKAS